MGISIYTSLGNKIPNPWGYGTSAKTTVDIGDTVARIMFENNINPEHTTIIGHSLGAQSAGFTGQAIKDYYPPGIKLGRIIALDPAGPAF